MKSNEERRSSQIVLLWGLRAVFIAASIFCVGFGLDRGEVRIVFQKAVRICMECIGLG